MNWFLFLSLSFVLASYLCSLRVFWLDMPAIFRNFSFFLLFVFLGECFGIAWPRVIYRHTPFSQGNQWFYNYFHFFCYLFYLWFFYRLLESPVTKRVIGILAAAYTLFAVSNWLFGQGPVMLNTYTDLFACFMMVFLSIATYFQLLYAKEVIVLQRSPLFWISTGVLIYHLGSMMGLFLINVMNVISNERAQYVHIIIMFSAVLMYINYSIVFLCAKRICTGKP
jgi:hypothetical protein